MDETKQPRAQIEFGEKFQGFRDFECEARFLSEAIDAFRPGGRKILDLACGNGKHCIELAALGYETTGLDADPKRLAEVEQASSAAGREVELVLADMGEFSMPNRFDLVFNFFYGMQNILFTRAKQEQGLSFIHESLVPGGLLVFDVINERVNLRQFPPGPVHLVCDGAETGVRVTSKSHVASADLKVIEMTFESGTPSPRKTVERYFLRRMTYTKIRRLLEKTGFRLLKVVSDFDFEARFSADSSARMIVVAQRALSNHHTQKRRMS